MAKLRKVKFNIAENIDDKKIVINKMIGQKSKRYEKTNVWNMFTITNYKSFYESLAFLSSKVFKVHCASLSIDNNVIATHLGIYDKNTFYYLMPANNLNDWENFFTR